MSTKNETFHIRVGESLKEKYKEFCEENGFSVSKRLRLFMQKDMEGDLEIKKENKKDK